MSTISEVSRRFNVSKHTISRAMKKLEIEGKKYGNRIVLNDSEVEKLQSVLKGATGQNPSSIIDQIKTLYEALESFTSADNVTLKDIQKRQNFLERLPDLIELHQALLEQQKIRLQLLGE